MAVLFIIMCFCYLGRAVFFHWDGKIVGFYFEILILQYHKQNHFTSENTVLMGGGGCFKIGCVCLPNHHVELQFSMNFGVKGML